MSEKYTVKKGKFDAKNQRQFYDVEWVDPPIPRKASWTTGDIDLFMQSMDNDITQLQNAIAQKQVLKQEFVNLKAKMVNMK